MVNKNLFWIVFIGLTINTNGQSFKVETSQPIEEKLGMPVLFMKNGYTVFAYDDVRGKKLFLTVFDEKRKIIVNKPLEFKVLETDFLKRHYAKMDVTIDISGWSEVNDKIVLGLLDDHYQGKYNNEMKYNVVINPKTGIIEEEKNATENAAYHYSTVRDKKTNNYYVQDYQLKEKGAERGKLTFSYYNNDGKKLGSIPFDYLENNETKADVLSWVNLGNEKIGAITLVSKDKKEPKIVFSVYDFAKNSVSNKILFDVPEDLEIETTDLTLVPNSDFVNVLFYIKTGAKSNKTFYQLMYQNIDFVKLEPYKPFYPTYEKLNDFVKAKCEIKKGYEGGFVYSTLLDEKGNIFSVRVKNVTSIYGKNVSTLNPELVGVMYCDINGKELNAWAFSYNNGGSSGSNGNFTSRLSDFSFKVISNKRGNFLILNDLEKNSDIPLNEKASHARITDECNTMVVSFTENGQVKKDFLFGKPQSKKQNKYADLTNAIYDEKSNSLVTIYYEGEGYKNNRAAWIKLD